MITKDNIQKVLLELKFISNHGVYTRHFGSADDRADALNILFVNICVILL